MFCQLGRLFNHRKPLKSKQRHAQVSASLFLLSVVIRFNLGRRAVAKNVISGIYRAWAQLFIIRNGC